MNIFPFLRRPQKFGYCLLMATAVVLTGCGKSDDKASKNDEVKPTEKEVPMSAAPAKTKEAPIAVGDDSHTKVIAPIASSAAEGTVIEPPAPKEAGNEKVGKGKNKKASAVDATLNAEGEADNSAMDSISENDQVIDDAPASPDAPQAKEGEEKSAVKNEPVHKRK